MPPSIPPRFSSLLPTADQEGIAVLTSRSVSASTAFSSLSSASSTAEFLDTKMESLAADIAANSRIKEVLNDAKRRRDMTDIDFREAMGETETDLVAAERELVVIKRQKKVILDDMDEVLPRYHTVGEAYTETITTSVMAVTSQQKKDGPSHQKTFRQGVIKYYGAEREDDEGNIQKYCHLTGWLNPKFIKCAHIVPKSLASDELAYLFGVRETMLTEPRNGLVLNHVIETALDNGNIVFVPDKPVLGKEIIWRCLLIRQSMASQFVNGETRWRDINGRALTFLTPNRPARRYLYLRYAITCIYQKRIGNVEWLDQALLKNEARGYIWATPGPYLRRSMLITLARKVSDHFLPEAFYGQSTFTEADGCPGRSADAEEDLAMGLNLRIDDAFAEADQRRRDEEEFGGESDDDDDEA